jgi:hypothetical protein
MVPFRQDGEKWRSEYASRVGDIAAEGHVPYETFVGSPKKLPP